MTRDSNILALFVPKDGPSGPLWALFFAASAIIIAIQTYHGYKNGYAYRGKTEKAFRAQQPGWFKFWFCVQCLGVAALSGFAIYALIA